VNTLWRFGAFDAVSALPSTHAACAASA
jgi:hypothetical protein